MAEIKIEIDKTKFPPALKLEVDGMKGGGCASFADDLQSVLRLETARQTLKPDFKEVKQKLPMRR